MHLDKMFNCFKKNRYSLLLQCLVLLLSLLNVFSNASNKMCFASLPEIVANDLTKAKSNNHGLVFLELKRKDGTSNFISSWEYYYKKIAEKNRSGKTFFTSYSKDPYAELDENLPKVDVNLSIGTIGDMTNNDLNISLLAGNFPDNSQKALNTSFCLVSKTVALSINENINQVVGKEIKYCETKFIICGIVEDECFVTKETTFSDSRFIVTDFSDMKSKEWNYTFCLLLKKDKYYDNYTVLKRVFFNIYREYNDYYTELKIQNNQWIEEDIGHYGDFRKTYDLFIFSILAAFAFLIGCLYRFGFYYFKIQIAGKKKFILNFCSTSLYFSLSLLIGLILNHITVDGIHLNTFSSLSCLFLIAFFAMFILGNIVTKVAISIFISKKPSKGDDAHNDYFEIRI